MGDRKKPAMSAAKKLLKNFWKKGKSSIMEASSHPQSGSIDIASSKTTDQSNDPEPKK